MGSKQDYKGTGQGVEAKMSGLCVSKKEASKLLGVSLRMITNYLKSGELTEHHREKRMVMVDVSEVYSLREENKKRKRGK